MNENDRKEFADWLDSPQSELPLAMELIRVSNDGGLYFEVPETNGFPANRFAGRLIGYMYALTEDRIKPEQEFRINMETIKPYVSQEEIDALGKLQEKIKEQSDKEIPAFDDGYVGRLEGITIYLDKEDLSLLYTEKNIDLNRGRDADGIPSYAYQKSHLKAGLQLAKCDKSREEVIEILKGDGLKEKGAAMIVDRMIAVIKQQRKKAAIKAIVVGAAILIVGLIITGITYINAVSNGGGRYILAWGALGGGGFYTFSGIVSYIKALNYSGQG